MCSQGKEPFIHDTRNSLTGSMLLSQKFHKALLSLEKSMLFKRIPRQIWVTCTTALPCLEEHKWDFICRIRTRSPALVQVQQRKSCPGGNNIDFNWNVMWIETHHVAPVWAPGQPKKWSNPKRMPNTVVFTLATQPVWSSLAHAGPRNAENYYKPHEPYLIHKFTFFAMRPTAAVVDQSSLSIWSKLRCPPIHIQ